jgi:hypothetical protein
VLWLAVYVLGFTVLLGAALAFFALRHPGQKPPRMLLALHGVAALLGYLLLLWALQGPARGGATGTQSFGMAAAVLLLLAALFGIASLTLHLRRRRLPGLWVGLHASIAIAGYVILAVYVLVG